MENQLESYTSVDMTSAGDGGNVLELKLKALILDTIHNIDVIDQLHDNGTKALDEWQWQKQLRSVILVYIIYISSILFHLHLFTYTIVHLYNTFL